MINVIAKGLITITVQTAATLFKKYRRASLVAQWLRIHQCRGHGFEPWSKKIPHAAEQLSPDTTTTEPALWSPQATTTEPARLGPMLRNKEKPPE